MPSDKDILTISIAAGLASLAVAWMMLPDGSTPTDETDGPGPNLVIVMGGGAEGRIVIDLYDDIAPQSAQRLIQLTEAEAYNGVVFHRVIEGFMAQTGDVEFGNISLPDQSRAGYGKSDLPNVPAEFSDIEFERGIVGMARGSGPDSANSQFFIMFDRAPNLDNKYTAVGHVVAGMDVVDQIKKGDPNENGAVYIPDFIANAWIER